jgi:ubiquinone/menaquinone biosynthesis C-methylase UbiE
MRSFEHEGTNYWKNFGTDKKLLPMLFPDFITYQVYSEKLSKYNLKGKKVLDIGAGYPTPEYFSDWRIFPASRLHDVLENKGAKIIALDVALDPLQKQKESGNTAVNGDTFHLPFANESIDGGAVISNLFNSSFPDENNEILINAGETKKILGEAGRALKKDTFIIINNHYFLEFLNDDSISNHYRKTKILGPELENTIQITKIIDLLDETGFSHNIETVIKMDERRIDSGLSYFSSSIDKAIKNDIHLSLPTAYSIIGTKK